MNKKRLFVISVDAMVKEDLEYLKTKENFSGFMKNTSGPDTIMSIYPSVTYPAHASLQTGCYPDKHGIFSNKTFVADGKNAAWAWDYNLMKVKTIFQAAKEGGYSTGAVFWPVTAYNPYIDYHVVEYTMPYKTDSLRGSYSKMGASPRVMEIIEDNAKYLPPTYPLTGKENVYIEPYWDDFAVNTTCDIIKEFAPEFMVLHICIIDDYRHRYGAFGPKIIEGLDCVDEYFGKLIQAIKDSGHYDDTNIIVLSDHGQKDSERTIYLNSYFVQEGLIRLDEENNIADYDVYSISNGMSTTVWLKNPDDRVMYDKVYNMLCDLANEGKLSVQKVYKREELVDEYHLNGDFDFIVENDGKSAFSNSHLKPVEVPVDKDDHTMTQGDHGYFPHNGPQPIFMAKGPDIKPDVALSVHSVVDVAPTIAELLGVELPEAQGKSMSEILK